MILLLDTHVFIWQVMGDQRLKSAQRKILEDRNNKIFLSAVSIFEMSIKAGLGKLDLPSVYNNNLLQIYDDFDFEPLAVQPSHSNAAGFLPGLHRDPFDRLLVAQAIIEGIPIMTADDAFKGLGARVVW